LCPVGIKEEKPMRLSIEELKAQVRPEVDAAARIVAERERDVLDYLAAYDRGQATYERAAERTAVTATRTTSSWRRHAAAG
jgi:hypothetical protein